MVIMRQLRRTGALLALVLILLLVLGVGPALAAAPPQSGTGTLPGAPQTAAPAQGALLYAPTVVGIDYAPSAVKYDFSSDAEYSWPMGLPGYGFGRFSGIFDVRVVGHSWNMCPFNSWPVGKHIAFVPDGVAGLTITFDQPQSYASVSVQPNLWYYSYSNPLYFNVTMTAYDKWGYIIGSYTKSMAGFYGPQYIGLKTLPFLKANISYVRITAVPDAWGFALTDLMYGPGLVPGRQGH